MEVSVRRAFSLTGILIALIILPNTIPCRATSFYLKKFYGQNNATIADNLKLEFLQDYVIGRMLVDKSFVSLATLNSKKQAVDCDRGNPYHRCLPHPNPKPAPPQRCNRFNRNC
ncbi:hypothetical protein CRYUN_Cryun20dG0119700 [Craigia yunnanensis]